MKHKGLSKAAVARIKSADPKLLVVLRQRVKTHLAGRKPIRFGRGKLERLMARTCERTFESYENRIIEEVLVEALRASTEASVMSVIMGFDFAVLATAEVPSGNQLAKLYRLAKSTRKPQ